jgi:tetratricopeptide (TPR) repeat protein
MLTKSSDNSSIPGRIVVIDMLIIAALWCISLFIVNPFGNFPLNDDWAYGLAVKHLIENGDYRPSGWPAMPLITNVLWGALFCVPAGFSFTALRLSTLTLSFLGLLGCYLLMRNLQQPRWLALIATLTLGFNPLYYALSNTFMTDVPYTALTVFAAIFFARSLRTGSDFALLIGTILAVAATLSRQLALSVPLAFAVSLILMRGFTNRNLLRAAIPPALCLGVLLLFHQWLAASGRLPALYGKQTGELLRALGHPKALAFSLANNTFRILFYLGWFLLPVLIFTAAGILRSHRKSAIVIFAFMAATLLVVCGVRYLHREVCVMPLWGNVLDRSGIGPFTLRDTFYLHLDHVPALPVSFWFAITAVGLLGAALLVATLGVLAIHLVPRIGFGGKASEEAAVGIFLLLTPIIYLLPTLAVEGWDRYVVPVIPFAAAGIAALSTHFAPFLPLNTRTLRFSAAALLAAFSVFAIGSTRDYLAWNRVRWQALHELMHDGQVKAQDIDGGFEFNGLYWYDPDYHEVPGKSAWWVQNDTYQIAFQNIPGYHVIKEYSYQHWLPPYVGKVVVLRQNSPIDEAIRQGQEIIRLKPDNAEAHNKLGIALSQKGQTAEAIRQFQETLRLRPNNAEAHNNLGIALGQNGQTAEAIRQFQESIRLKPDYPDAHNNLGAALELKGQTDEAIRHFQEALRLKPGYANARKNLDAVLATKARSSPLPGASTNR